jgi:hypothetical protein
LGGRPPLRCLRFACKSLKHSEPRFATFLPPFRLSATGRDPSFFQSRKGLRFLKFDHLCPMSKEARSKGAESRIVNRLSCANPGVNPTVPHTTGAQNWLGIEDRCRCGLPTVSRWFCLAARVAGMNSAHSWHTSLFVDMVSRANLNALFSLPRRPSRDQSVLRIFFASDAPTRSPESNSRRRQSEEKG